MTAGQSAHISRLNADPAFRAKVRAAASDGMKRWWDGKRLPKMTAQQRWKYRTLRELHGREVALATLFPDHAASRVPSHAASGPMVGNREPASGPHLASASNSEAANG